MQPIHHAGTQLKYQRIEAEIRQLAKTLPLQAKLPAERDLAVTYECNFLTVRKALKQLVDEGIIVRRVGSGTFIARHPSDQGAATQKPAGDRLGILVYQHSNAYAFRLLQAIAHASMELGVELRSVWVPDFGEGTVAKAAMLQRDGCVALALPWFPHELTNEIRRFVSACPLPVSLPLLIPGLEKNCFEREEVFGGSSLTLTMEDMCRYYRALGHQRIALIGPDSVNDVILQHKISGYVHYTSREKLPSMFGLVGPGSPAMDQLAKRWQEYRGDLAVVSYDDEHALRFMTAMHKLGLSAPEDFCIVGYNDSEISRFCDPPLTTVHQSFDYIAHWLLKNAIGLSKGAPDQSAQMPRLRLLVRESCGGRSLITDQFSSQFQHIDIIVDSEARKAESDAEAPAVAQAEAGAVAESIY